MRHPEDREATDRADGELLERVARGDLAAFRRLYDRYRPLLHRFLRRYNPRDALVEEVVNDSMYAVWCNASKFRGDSRPSTWIHAIAYRQGMKRFARQERAAESCVTEEPSAVSGEDQVIREDWIRAALEELPEEQRTIVELTYFHGHSCEEVAGQVSCPVNTVKTRMFHARRKLREHLLQLAGDSEGTLDVRTSEAL